jgi:hypothetical protein
MNRAQPVWDEYNLLENLFSAFKIGFSNFYM